MAEENEELCRSFPKDPPPVRLYQALAKAYKNFGTVKKSGQVSYGGKPVAYATLDDILTSVKKPLADEGIILMQDVRFVDSARVGVKTILIHESGERLESSELYMPVETGNARCNRAQAFGSARTYACRYSLASFLSIASEDDTDGNAYDAPNVQTRRTIPSSAGKNNPPPELDDVPF